MQSNVSVPASNAARSFLFVFLLVPVLAFVFPFVAERAPKLKELSEGVSTHAYDYAYTSRDDADIVFFGDSTAMYGPDMVDLSRMLGMKAINLPQTIGTLPVMHEMALRAYLQHNKAPKLIVFHFAPWNLDAYADHRFGFFDGEEQIVRHEGLPEFIGLTRSRPLDMLLFAFRFYLVHNRLNWLWYRSYDPMEVTQGHAVRKGFGPMTADCHIPDEFLQMTGTASAEDLLQKFGRPGTKVMLYLAPLPACTNAKVVAEMSHGRLQVDSSIVLPAAGFANDHDFVHPLAISSEVRTQAMAKSIRKELAR
jgi:hypothetical protein